MAGGEFTRQDARVYRFEVEIIELSSGASRRVPLTFHQLVAFARTSRSVRRAGKGAAPSPTSTPLSEEPPRLSRSEVMRLVDEDFVLEAANWEEFRLRLRERYPDSRFERRLHVQRDREAEERREEAIQGLIKLVADAVVADFLKEQTEALEGLRQE